MNCALKLTLNDTVLTENNDEQTILCILQMYALYSKRKEFHSRKKVSEFR